MRLTSRKNLGASVELQMTSMIDVTFLLLIFFLVTSAFMPTERDLDPGIKVNKPSAAEVTSHVEPAIVDIVQAEGRFVYKLGGREMNTAAELLDVLRKLDNKGEGAFVRTEDAAPFDMAARAIQSCKSAGFINVQYIPKGG